MRFASVLVCFGTVTIASAQFALRDGDRVAFYGDSITDNSPYTKMVETYVVLRHPEWNVRFFNAGVGGDRVSGGWMGAIDDRLTRDLFARKPTVVTMMLGMNDGGYTPFDQKRYETFDAGYRHILDRVRSEIPKARLWLIKPSPYDDVTRTPGIPGGYNSVILRYGQAVGELSKQYGHWCTDFNFNLADALFKANAVDPARAAKIVPDRVHPSWVGHLVMACTLLSSWNAESLKSEVGIDAPSGAVVANHAKVSRVVAGEALAWTQLDDWLPFPINRYDAEVELILASAPVVSQIIGGQTLRITGLTAPSYTLSIDGVKAGVFSAQELKTGVELGKAKTPMNEQANELELQTQRRCELMYYLWRQIEAGLEKTPGKARDEVIASVNKLQEEVIRQQHELAKPKPHRFELSANKQ